MGLLGPPSSPLIVARLRPDRANNDTFHLTHCGPQHKLFNRSAQVWAGLEDYLLDRARAAGLRACVFTGPVLREDDPEFAGTAIPLEFWKVVVALTGAGQLSATAYVVSQAEQVRTMRLRAAPPFGPFKTYQVAVANVQQRTGLGFGRLRRHDPLGRPALRAAPPRALECRGEIVL
ncbi:MAG: DNA/RNA non-specific endonuclease [Limisphaerales bacterium]